MIWDGLIKKSGTYVFGRGVWLCESMYLYVCMQWNHYSCCIVTIMAITITTIKAHWLCLRKRTIGKVCVSYKLLCKQWCTNIHLMSIVYIHHVCSMCCFLRHGIHTYNMCGIYVSHVACALYTSCICFMYAVHCIYVRSMCSTCEECSHVYGMIYTLQYVCMISLVPSWSWREG